MVDVESSDDGHSLHDRLQRRRLDRIKKYLIEVHGGEETWKRRWEERKWLSKVQRLFLHGRPPSFRTYCPFNTRDSAKLFNKRGHMWTHSNMLAVLNDSPSFFDATSTWRTLSRRIVKGIFRSLGSWTSWEKKVFATSKMRMSVWIYLTQGRKCSFLFFLVLLAGQQQEKLSCGRNERRSIYTSICTFYHRNRFCISFSRSKVWGFLCSECRTASLIGCWFVTDRIEGNAPRRTRRLKISYLATLLLLLSTIPSQVISTQFFAHTA